MPERMLPVAQPTAAITPDGDAPNPAGNTMGPIANHSARTLMALLIGTGLLPAFTTAAPPEPQPSVTELHSRIVRDSATMAKTLSPEAQQAYRDSLQRFLAWVETYCAVPDSLNHLDAGQERCVNNEYSNYLARIPASIYKIGGLTLYETQVHAALWPDDNLQGTDPQRRFTWSLSIIWPRIDAPPAPKFTPFLGALAGKVQNYEAEWVRSGWEGWIEAHVEAINACYASATLTEDTYSGGAHPYEAFLTFNWNQRTRKPLDVVSLFRPSTDWKNGLLPLYRKHLLAAGYAPPDGQTPIGDEDLGYSIPGSILVTDEGLRFMQHQGRWRFENLPAVTVPWNELEQLVLPTAACDA